MLRVSIVKIEKEQNDQNDLAAVMITYPSTSSGFEDSICEVCGPVHHYGGQVSRRRRVESVN